MPAFTARGPPDERAIRGARKSTTRRPPSNPARAVSDADPPLHPQRSAPGCADADGRRDPAGGGVPPSGPQVSTPWSTAARLLARPCPGGQSPSSQHGVDQQACAQQDEADGERGEHGGQRRLAPHLRQLERRVAGEPLAGLNLDCRDPPSVTSSPGGGALHGAVLLTGQMLR